MNVVNVQSDNSNKKQTIVSKLRPKTIPVNRPDGAREQDLAAVDCCY